MKKNLSTFFLFIVNMCFVLGQNVSINSKSGYQEIDGFGDCSTVSLIKKTYEEFGTTKPEKLDDIADMLFTTNNPDSSFGFKFFHQIGIGSCIDWTNRKYIPKSEKDNSVEFWYSQKLAERGGNVGLRYPVAQVYKYKDSQGRARVTDEDIPKSMELIVNVMGGIKNDYGYTFSEYTPMNESSADWWKKSTGADLYLTNAQTVKMINEARVALDNAGFNDVGLVAFDAFHINNHGRLDNMLNSDAVDKLSHLSYHQYQNLAGSQDYWYKQGLVKHDLKIWQTEWGDWGNLNINERHAQAMNYAKHIFQALGQGKVSAWHAWENKFIFDLDANGWAPREAAWMMAQFSRFADPGMVMLSTSNLNTSSGTLAFIEQKTGKRDLSIISLNAESKDTVLNIDLTEFDELEVLDARITGESHHFEKTKVGISSESNILRVYLPAETMVSVRLSVTGNDVFGQLQNVYQAEEYSLTSSENVFSKGNDDYSGFGFMNMGSEGSWLKWNNIYSEQAQSAVLSFRYTNGTTGDLTADVFVNSGSAQKLTLPSTGDWESWSEVTLDVSLSGGNNEVRFKGTSECPDLDKITVYFNGLIPASEVAATANSSSEVTLTWKDNSEGETSYVVERKEGHGGVYTPIDTLSANAVSYTDTDLASPVTYVYRLIACNTTDSVYSAKTDVVTDVSVFPPSELKISSVLSGAISISWNDTLSNEEGYIVCRKEGKGGIFNEYAQLGANINTYTDNAVTSNTEYYYALKSFVSKDKSELSNIVSQVAESSLKSPSELKADISAEGDITLSWTDNSDNETSFVIQRGTGVRLWKTIDTVTANSVSYLDTTFSHMAAYYYRIKAINAGDASEWSDEVLAPRYNADPTNLTLSRDKSGNIVLNWTDNSAFENGVKIERSFNGSGFAEIERIEAADISSYVDENPEFGFYNYRVRHIIVGVSNTGFSNVASLTLLPEGMENLALNKSVKVSSNLSSNQGKNAVDGDVSSNESRWVTADGASYPHWIEIDLEKEYEVSAMKVYTGYQGQYNKEIKDFRFQYWNGTDWANFVSVVDNSDPLYGAFFDGVNTAKVRLYITKSSENYVRLYEVEVFGKEAAVNSTNFTSMANSITFYPNPADDELYISGIEKGCSIRIYSLPGTLIMRQQNELNRIDVSSLAPGIYVLRTSNNKAIQFIKK